MALKLSKREERSVGNSKGNFNFKLQLQLQLQLQLYPFTFNLQLHDSFHQRIGEPNRGGGRDTQI